jgi:NADPH2:quinone reductase
VGEALGPIEGYQLRLKEVPAPGPGEVRVAVKAAGVSFVDVLVSQGRYQAKPLVPFTPGSEFAGVVEEVGEGVTELQPGQPVVGTCWGGVFAEALVVPARALWPAPEGLSFEVAAVVPVSYATVWHGLHDRGQVRAGETLLVLGAGGATGLAAVQLGVHLGARVVASASSQAKRAMALEAGAAAAVDSGAPDWREAVKAACGGKAVDVVFDPVGGEATERAFRTLGVGGRHLVVGFPAGIPQLPTNLPLLKSASLVGVNVSQMDRELGRANHARVLALAGQGVCRPVIARTYPLEAFAEAMAEAARGESAGRIVISLP